MLGFAIFVASVLAAFFLAIRFDCSVTGVAIIIATFLVALTAVYELERASTIAVTTALVLASTTAFGLAFQLSMPIATMKFYAVDFERSFSAMMGIALVAVFAPWYAALGVQRMCRAILPAAMALLAVTVIFAALGVRSLTRPPPDAYPQTITTTRLALGGETTVGAMTFRYDFAPGNPSRDRHCQVTANGVDIAEARGTVHAPVLDCSPVTIASDAHADAVVVFTKDPAHPIAIRRMNGDNRAEFGIADLGGRLGTPRGWVFGTFGTIAVACFALGMALRLRRRPIRGVEGIHEGSGWIRVDGVPRFVAEIATYTPGALVVIDETSSSPTYRDDGAAKIFTWKSGTLATLADEQRARVASWACVALASCVIGVAPLIVAHVHGLL